MAEMIVKKPDLHVRKAGQQVHLEKRISLDEHNHRPSTFKTENESIKWCYALEQFEKKKLKTEAISYPVE